MYPKIVYHKDYLKAVDEKERQEKSRKVLSAEHHKKLGADWGDHPGIKKVVAEKTKKDVEKPESLDVENETSQEHEAPKKRYGRSK